MKIIKEVTKEDVAKLRSVEGEIYILSHYFTKENFKEDFSDMDETINEVITKRLETGNRLHVNLSVADFMADEEYLKEILQKGGQIKIKAYCFEEKNIEEDTRINILIMTYSDVYIMNEDSKTIERI